MMKKNVYYIFMKLRYKHINCYYVLKAAVIGTLTSFCWFTFTILCFITFYYVNVLES